MSSEKSYSPKRFRCPQAAAGITQSIHPHLSRHQMLTYLTSKGLSDAQIQLISGHESKKSLEVYQHLSLESVDKGVPGCGPERGDLKRFLWDFTYLCWANPTVKDSVYVGSDINQNP